MSTQTRGNTDNHIDRSSRNRLAETRSAKKTTELMAYIGAVLAVAITALLVGDGGDGGADPFSAEQALRLITFLTVGYMLARGLAKSGTRGHDHEA